MVAPGPAAPLVIATSREVPARGPEAILALRSMPEGSAHSARQLANWPGPGNEYFRRATPLASVAGPAMLQSTGPRARRVMIGGVPVRGGAKVGDRLPLPALRSPGMSWAKVTIPLPSAVLGGAAPRRTVVPFATPEISTLSKRS